ncbi:hypothetical protein SALB_03475 [Streptomyces noursei]|uniref:NlpC/P60 domain-containing protein n=1 Tax=Streptomyces noursei TaxID=1971 RepID=A0A401QZG7_STRNR|nr:hypothetical protein SALB_03475 [Streptomyces noursei]
MVSHRRTSQRGQTTLASVTVLSAALATAAAALSAQPASADPSGARAGSTGAAVAGHSADATDREGATARVGKLYEEAERATEKFNGANARTKELRDQVSALQDRAARTQEWVNRLRARLGAVAAAQYRSGGLDPTVRLLLSERPEGYLEKASALDRLSGAQAHELHRLQAATRELEQQRREAARKLAQLEIGRAEVAHHKKDVQRKLATARRLLNALPSGARSAYERASRSDGRDEIIPDLSGVVAGSGRAAAAVAAARAAVGAPTPGAAPAPRPSTAPGSPNGPTTRPGSRCRAPPRRSAAPAPASRCPRPAPATWSSTARTPVTSGCTSATGRSCTRPIRAPGCATTRSA